MGILRTFSYNLRMDNPYDGRNAFSKRKDFIRSAFPKYKADIIGFQEVLPHMRQWLMDNFHEYVLCGVGRGKKLDDESNVILYRRDKYDLVSLDTFWLSDTPRIAGSRFSTDQSHCPRICTTVTLYDRTTGKCFRHYNTHLDHEGKFAQAQGMSLILNRMAADYAASPMPVILTGDFNVTPESVVVKSILGFEGCGKKLIDATCDIDFTFHGYNPDKIHSKIDYIFTNMACRAQDSYACTDEDDGVYLSDHYPVGAELSL